MRFGLLILSIVVSSILALGSYQDPREAKRRFVRVPAESILLVVAAQPDCPIQFDDSTLIVSADDNQWGVTGLVRNRGTKPIRSYTVSIWTSAGVGGTLQGSEWSSGKVTSKLIMPGQTIKENSEAHLVPLTDELREKLKLRGPMSEIAVLIVERVVFDDGSSFSDESAAQALRSYFDYISDILRAQQSKQKKR